MVLWLLGAASAALYLVAFTLRFPLWEHYASLNDLANMGGRDLRAAALYLGPISLLFLMYLLAWRRARALPRRALVPVYAGAVVFGLIAVGQFPVTAIDLYVYLVDGRLWAIHDANPLVVRPNAFPDQFTPLAGQYADGLAPYGPVWIALTGAVAALAGDDLLLGLLGLKLLALLSYLGCCAAITWVLRRTSPGLVVPGTLLFAWNPLVLLDGVANAHNDAAMMLPVLVAVGLALSGRGLPALAVLTLSIAVKYSTVLLLPVFYLYLLRRQPPGRRLLFTAAAGLVTAGMLALLYAPFWDGPQTFAAVLDRNQLFLGSVGALLNALRERWAPGMPGQPINQALMAGFGLVYLAQLWLLWRGQRSWLRVGFEVLFWAMFTPSWFNSWFVIWPLALAALCPVGRVPWRAAVLSYTVLLGAFFFIYKTVWDPTGAWSFVQVHVLAVPVLFGPALLVSLWPDRWVPRRPARPQADLGAPVLTREPPAEAAA